MTPDDMRAATETFAAALLPVADADWSAPAGTLTWSCAQTLRHVGDCLIWYALNLSARTAGPDDGWEFEVLESPTAGTLSLVSAAGALLADTVAAAPRDARGWHPYGIADASGFAGMGADEVLVHGYDIASTFAVSYDPPRSVCAHVVNRLFPWAPPGFDPWTTMLWCNGRAELPGHERVRPRWRWHCAPLADWEGSVPSD